jgi:hypothetical protein
MGEKVPDNYLCALQCNTNGNRLIHATGAWESGRFGSKQTMRSLFPTLPQIMGSTSPLGIVTVPVLLWADNLGLRSYAE